MVDDQYWKSPTALEPRRNKVLIVEDDEYAQEILKCYLKNFHAEVFLANNGQEALEIVNQIPDLNLILMDIHMPVMDGLIASSQIKTSHPHIPIIMETAYGNEFGQDHFISYGCERLLRKPLSLKDFLQAVKDYL